MRPFLFAAGVAVGLTFSVVIAAAWTGPTASPPNNNVDAPINVGTTDQIKNGGIGVNALAVFGNTLLDGTNGDGNGNGVNSYLSFGATAGQSGYGFRDDAGTIEYKDSADANWMPFAWATSGNTIYNTNSGSVGIGTSDPDATLDIEGYSTNGGSPGATSHTLIAVNRDDTTGSPYGIIGETYSATGAGTAGTDESTGASGMLGLGSWGIYCYTGECGGSSPYVNTSDARLKTDVEPIDDALDKILQLNGVYFRWIDPTKNAQDGQQMGLIAQDVQAVFPQAVTIDTTLPNALPGGTKMLAYSDLIAPIIDAIKELYADWSADHQTLLQLQNQVNAQQQQIDGLKTIVCQDDPNASVCD
jgi:hypothetical protein